MNSKMFSMINVNQQGDSLLIEHIPPANGHLFY